MPLHYFFYLRRFVLPSGRGANEKIFMWYKDKKNEKCAFKVMCPTCPP
jgi:hypothetical protein